MSPLVLRLREGLLRVWEILPALVFAIAIMIFGYFLARRLESWIDRLLKRLDFNRMAEARGIREAVGRTGSHLDPVHAVGKLIFWVIMLMVTLLASAALGMESINEMFGIMVSFIPTLIAAIVIVILGMVVGEFLRGLILASAGAVTGVPTLARVSKALVVVIAIFMAFQQLGVSEEMITSLLTIVLGAVALAVGLAFGLGNTKLAGEITREWYEQAKERRGRAALDPDQPCPEEPDTDEPVSTGTATPFPESQDPEDQ